MLEVDILNLWMEPDDGQAETPDHMAAQEGNVNISVSHTRGRMIEKKRGQRRITSIRSPGSSTRVLSWIWIWI